MKDDRFAWQGIAGVRIPLSDNVDLGLKYRYFRVNNLDLEDDFGDELPRPTSPAIRRWRR